MVRTLHFHNLLILTWSSPYSHLKQLYPDAQNLLVIGNWCYSNCLPSTSVKESTKKGWAEAFQTIVEVDVEEDNVIDKVVKTLRYSEGNWLMLANSQFKVEKAMAEALNISLISGARATIEEMEEVF